MSAKLQIQIQMGSTAMMNQTLTMLLSLFDGQDRKNLGYISDSCVVTSLVPHTYLLPR